MPPDVHSSQEIDDLLSTLERQGIEIYEDLATATAARAVANATEGPDAPLVVAVAADSRMRITGSPPASRANRAGNPTTVNKVEWKRTFCGDP